MDRQQPRNAYHRLDQANDATSRELLELLQTIGQDSFTQRYMGKTLQALNVEEGDTLLEVGCGVAYDSDTLLNAVGPNGKLLLLDKSEQAIDQANRNLKALSPDSTNFQFIHGLATGLELPTESVNRVRCVRTMMYVEPKEQGIAEIARVLKVGGKAVFTEPDWNTMYVDGNSDTVAILGFYAKQFTNQGIGKELSGLVSDAGLDHQEVHVFSREVDSFEKAEKYYSLTARANDAASLGIVTQEAADAWIADLRGRDSKGKFYLKLNVYMLAATKTALT